MKIGIKIYQVSWLEVGWEMKEAIVERRVSSVTFDVGIDLWAPCRVHEADSLLVFVDMAQCFPCVDVWGKLRGLTSTSLGLSTSWPPRSTTTTTNMALDKLVLLFFCLTFFISSAEILQNRKVSPTQTLWYDRNKCSFHPFMGVKDVCTKFLHSLDLCCFIYSDDMMVVLMAARTRSMFVSHNKRFKHCVQEIRQTIANITQLMLGKCQHVISFRFK